MIISLARKPGRAFKNVNVEIFLSSGFDLERREREFDLERREREFELHS